MKKIKFNINLKQECLNCPQHDYEFPDLTSNIKLEKSINKNPLISYANIRKKSKTKKLF